jgi:predicted dehydrogenase
MRNANNHRILISGLGSIGRRHLANLETLGYTDIAFHRSGKSTIDDPLPDHPSFSTLGEALEEFKPAVVFICGSSHTHMQVALESATTGAHLIIEKPLSHSLDDIAKLETLTTGRNFKVMVGYMMRFHPLLLRISDMIGNQAIGDLVHLRSQWGEYLPDWHPWEDYRDSYAANKSMAVALPSHSATRSTSHSGSSVIQQRCRASQTRVATLKSTPSTA